MKSDERKDKTKRDSRPLLLFYGRPEGRHGEVQRILNLSAQLLRFHSPLLFSLLPFTELPF